MISMVYTCVYSPLCQNCFSDHGNWGDYYAFLKYEINVSNIKSEFPFCLKNKRLIMNSTAIIKKERRERLKKKYLVNSGV